MTPDYRYPIPPITQSPMTMVADWRTMEFPTYLFFPLACEEPDSEDSQRTLHAFQDLQSTVCSASFPSFKSACIASFELVRQWICLLHFRPIVPLMASMSIFFFFMALFWTSLRRFLRWVQNKTLVNMPCNHAMPDLPSVP